MLSSKTVCKEIKLQHHGKDTSFDKLSSYRNPKDNSITFLKKFSDNLGLKISFEPSQKSYVIKLPNEKNHYSR